MVAAENLEFHQLDVKMAFLHGDLDEEIYMEQPQGFVPPDREHLPYVVYKRSCTDLSMLHRNGIRSYTISYNQLPFYDWMRTTAFRAKALPM